MTRFDPHDPTSNPLAGFPPEVQAQLKQVLSQTISDVNTSFSLTFWISNPFSLVPILSIFAAFGYFIGDWSSSLADEAVVVKQISSRQAKPAYYFYFIARLFGFLYLLLLLLFAVNGRKSQAEFNCTAVPKVFWAFNLISLGAAYALLALRCSALLGKRPTLTWMIYAAATATTLSYITGFVGVSGAQTFTGFISCTLFPVKKYVAISYLLSFLYDSFITCLSIYGLLSSTQSRQVTLKGPNANFLKKIIQGNALYFFVLISFSLGTGILTLVNVDPQIRAVLSAPHTATTVCMSLKIFRHLRSSVISPRSNSSRSRVAAGGSGSGNSGGQQKETLTANRSRQASFSSNFSPAFKRSEEIDMMPMANKGEDYESLR